MANTATTLKRSTVLKVTFEDFKKIIKKKKHKKPPNNPKHEKPKTQKPNNNKAQPFR